MGERNVSRPLTIGHEDIRFVEDDDESSSDHRHIHSKTPEISVEIPSVGNNHTSPLANKKAGSYAELSRPKLAVPKASDSHGAKPQYKEKFKTEPTQKTRRKSDLVLNIFSRTPSVRKSRQEYEKVSTREDSTYSSIVESPQLSPSKATSSGRGESFRLRGFPGGGDLSLRKSEAKGEDEDQILEVLRQVVRKCTNPDPLKRPTSKDVLDLVD